MGKVDLNIKMKLDWISYLKKKKISRGGSLELPFFQVCPAVICKMDRLEERLDRQTAKPDQKHTHMC